MVQAVSAAIVGIGATELSKFSGRSELRLALEACTTALSDAGIAPEEVDGLVTFAMDNNDEQAVAPNLGIDELTFLARPPARRRAAAARGRSRWRPWPSPPGRPRPSSATGR
jgi:acetyl-CoA acetyltransferase